MNDCMNICESNSADPLKKSERDRSNFVRELVQSQYNKPVLASTAHNGMPPKHIVQFWDDLNRLPHDVQECMESWKILEHAGFELQVFDDTAAREFIRGYLGPRYEKAFDKCYHPSMKSDYFRYSYIYKMGGFYIDADDVYHGKTIDNLFTDGRLKLQAFCYDIETAQMVPPSVYTNVETINQNWIYYFNNNPLIACPNHPIIERALKNATEALERELSSELPEVQSTTGPGNLTKSIFEVFNEGGCPKETIAVVHNWEKISTSKWPLSYRNDKRNWRLSNQQAYHASWDMEDVK